MNFVEEQIYDAPLSTSEEMHFGTVFCPRKHEELGLNKHPRSAINTMNWATECKVPPLGNKIASFLGKAIQSKGCAGSRSEP